METITQLIKAYLAVLTATPPANGEIISYAITDDSHGHYLVADVGWSGVQRIHAVVLHVRLVDDRVIIEHDGTPEGGIERWLIEHGVAPEHVIGAVEERMPLTASVPT